MRLALRRRNLILLDLASAQARLWHLDRYFRVTCFDATLSPPAPLGFAPFGGVPCDAPGPGGPVALSTDLALETGVESGVAVEALSDGSVLILESDAGKGFSTVHLRNPNLECINQIMLALVGSHRKCRAD